MDVSSGGRERSSDRVSRVIHRLRGEDDDVRESAADELERLAREGLSEAEGFALLDAACTEFPKRKFAILDSRSDLVRALGFQPRGAWIPSLVELYRQLSPKARGAALAVLAVTPGQESIQAILAILQAHARRRRVRHFPAAELAARRDAAELIFPSLLDFIDVAELTWPIVELALTWLSEERLDAARLTGQVDRIFRVYRPRRDRVREWEASGSVRNEEHARWVRETALLIDLLGRIPTPAVQAELKALVAGTDVHFKFFAACALLRWGRSIPEGVIDRVAANVELRAWLWEELESMGKSHLFPSRWRDPRSFAASELVRWLAWPAELGRVPD